MKKQNIISKNFNLINIRREATLEKSIRAAEMFYVDKPKKSFKRNVSTSIYFLLEGVQVSKFHRLRSDELWHFYDGTSVKVYVLDDKGKIDRNTTRQ